MLYSQNGTFFVAQKVRNWLRSIECGHLLITRRHPQSNGAAVRPLDPHNFYEVETGAENDVKSEIITPSRAKGRRENKYFFRLSCRFEFYSLWLHLYKYKFERKGTNITRNVIIFQGKYLLLKCTIFHTFISYFFPDRRLVNTAHATTISRPV